MKSSGTKISDLRAAVLHDPVFFDIMADSATSDHLPMQEYARLTIAVREECADWMIGLIDPAKVKSVKDCSLLVGLMRLRLVKTMNALMAGFRRESGDMMWDMKEKE